MFTDLLWWLCARSLNFIGKYFRYSQMLIRYVAWWSLTKSFPGWWSLFFHFQTPHGRPYSTCPITLSPSSWPPSLWQHLTRGQGHFSHPNPWQTGFSFPSDQHSARACFWPRHFACYRYCWLQSHNSTNHPLCFPTPPRQPVWCASTCLVQCAREAFTLACILLLNNLKPTQQTHGSWYLNWVLYVLLCQPCDIWSALSTPSFCEQRWVWCPFTQVPRNMKALPRISDEA